MKAKERWLPVHGYEGIYEVSNTGRVRSLDRVVDLSDGRSRKVNGKVLSPKTHKEGYLSVALSKSGTKKMMYVHRLVAIAFIPNPLDLPEVNHLSGDKSCNRPDNLMWVSHQDNVIHAYQSGLSLNQGGSHYFAVGVIDNIIGRRFETTKEWCDARGISYSTGRNLLNGKRKSRTIDISGVTKVSKTNDYYRTR